MLTPQVHVPLPISHFSVPAFQRFQAAGSASFSPLWSGQNPTGCREIAAVWLTQELAASLWQTGANS
jgi:nitronate monooxygenase